MLVAISIISTTLIAAALSYFFVNLSNKSKGLSFENLSLLQQKAENLQKQNDEQTFQILVLREKNSALTSQNAALQSFIESETSEKKELRNKFEQEKQQNGGLLSVKSLQEQQIQDQKTKINSLEQNLQYLAQEKLQLNSEISKLQANLNATKDEFNSLRKQFQLDATTILREKSQEFTQQNLQNLTSLLNPLGEELKNFKNKIQETYEKEARERISLENIVKNLQEKTSEVSHQANNLASALKGNFKIQGNWGEMLLEQILEGSGLVKNLHYFKEKSFVDDEGKNLRPDFQIQLPDNRIIITDSKVSLLAFERYASAANKEESEKFLAQHLQAIKNHIDGLSAKKYDDLQGSLDFTFMFLPIEPAYLLAIQTDDKLWSYGYQRRVILVSPTNLIACLKIIHDLWKREAQSRNALKIASQGQSLYEKFVGFTKSLEKIDSALESAKKAYEEAISQLSRGKGNLVRQAENLKKLGIKSEKQISPDLLESNECEDNLD